MPCERQLDPGREDPHLATLGVIHEDGLGEAEVGGHRLALWLGHFGALKEHAECVPKLARRRGEDAKDM